MNLGRFTRYSSGARARVIPQLLQGFKARTASSGEEVVEPFTAEKPTCSRSARYSSRVRSFPSV